jgi:hypothetical protein
LSSGTLLSRSSSLPALVFGSGTSRLLIFSSVLDTAMMSYDPWYSPFTIVAGTPFTFQSMSLCP